MARSSSVPQVPAATRAPAVDRLRWRTGLAVNISLLLVAVAFVVPMIWVVLAAFDGEAGLLVKLPNVWTLDNFSAVLTEEITIRPFFNSLTISVGASALVVALSMVAAYPLSRYKLRYGNTYIYTLIFASALPVTAIMVPVYIMFVNIGLVDSIPGVIIFRTATELPFAIWLTKSFMDAIPIELEESAWVDGASRLKGALRIIVPLMAPGMATIFILNFMENWGNFLVPFILLQSPDNYPMSVSLYSFFGQYGEVAYGPLAAFGVLYTLPSLLVYFLAQRPLSQGLRMGGAVKN